MSRYDNDDDSHMQIGGEPGMARWKVFLIALIIGALLVIILALFGLPSSAALAR